jgi:class 3 adenylate cyclase/predicted metal-dependent HD superfamily phosphohydrolase
MKNDDLLKRISELLSENRNLKEQLDFSQKENEKLIAQKLTLEQQFSKITTKNAEIKHFKMATILIIDFFGFSRITNKEHSSELIDELDNIFLTLKEISKKHKVVKIKTIGDSYMCAGGVPEKNTTNSIDVMLAAIEMKKHIDELQKNHQEKGKEFWSYKMGIHTGEVSAVILGNSKNSFNLKGETVDIVSRVKSIAYKGEIAISAMTYELIKEYFTCQYKGLLPLKYKKDYEIYSVKKIKKAYSQNRDGFFPNKIFATRYKLRQLSDLQEIILDKLENELPKYLYYHNVKHTIDVITQAELIGVVEGVTDYELLLLKTAALFHDIGQIHQSQGHEEIGCDYTKKWLPNYGYEPKEIEEINNLIMATKLPPAPKTLLEKIMCDADLDYLGRSDFKPVSDTLYKELKEQKIVSNIDDWNKMQIKFLEWHQYFTNTGNKLRQVNKEEQIKNLKIEVL